MTTAAPAIDPVCGMEIDPATALAVEYRGVTYWFCESACADTFREDPERWVGSAVEASARAG